MGFQKVKTQNREEGNAYMPWKQYSGSGLEQNWTKPILMSTRSVQVLSKMNEFGSDKMDPDPQEKADWPC